MFLLLKNNIRISGTTLTRNYDATLALVKEMLLEPRWDETEFDLLKKRAITNLRSTRS